LPSAKPTERNDPTMLTNSRTHRILWSECDPAGIVFYPRYFEMFDTSTTRLFEKATGMSAAQLFKHHDVIGYPLVDARARFVLPLAFSDDITIETEVAEFRRSSFEMRHQLLKDGKLAVEGFETRVWVGRHPDDPARMKSQPIPQEILARFNV
jgi:4-hydroxybenzoyl-CoA thioesterase